MSTLLLFPTNSIQQNRGSILKNMFDNRYKFCYTLDTYINNRIISQREY